MPVLSFHCNDKQGALLTMKDDAIKEQLIESRSLKLYISENHSSWYRFARDTLDLLINQEDIIFVYSTVKTTAWAVTAILDNQEPEDGHGPESRINIDVSRGRWSSNSVQFTTTGRAMNVLTRIGPSPAPTTLESNQTIFISYSKGKRRLRVWPRFLRGGSKSRDSLRVFRDEDDDEDEIEDEDGDEDMSLIAAGDSMVIDMGGAYFAVVCSRFPATYSSTDESLQGIDPVDKVLDYILDVRASFLSVVSLYNCVLLQHSDAECAFAQLDDIYTLCDRKVRTGVPHSTLMIVPPSSNPECSGCTISRRHRSVFNRSCSSH